MKFPITSSVLAVTYIQLVASSPTQHDEKRQLATYDYVIVGGGTAGLTMASRLSENSAITVAVIEAGTLYQVCQEHSVF
jgi:ribulose 1,5-bisphosphate synthetase/thiazole synthase